MRRCGAMWPPFSAPDLAFPHWATAIQRDSSVALPSARRLMIYIKNTLKRQKFLMDAR